MKENNENIKNKINELLKKVRPFLVNDGGDVELIKYEDGIAYVKMLGNCSNCIFSSVTMQNTIETILISEIPEIIEVRAISE